MLYFLLANYVVFVSVQTVQKAGDDSRDTIFSPVMKGLNLSCTIHPT